MSLDLLLPKTSVCLSSTWIHSRAAFVPIPFDIELSQWHGMRCRAVTMAWDAVRSCHNGMGCGAELSQWHWMRCRAVTMAWNAVRSCHNGVGCGAELSQWHGMRCGAAFSTSRFSFYVSSSVRPSTLGRGSSLTKSVSTHSLLMPGSVSGWW